MEMMITNNLEIPIILANTSNTIWTLTVLMVPSNITLRLDHGVLHKDNVYIGIISASEIKKCYDEFGEALFLDNIRDFLGITSGKIKVENRENVNEAIVETANDHPEKMLARNNGITFRSEKVSGIDNETLILENASIVNGCCKLQSRIPHDSRLKIGTRWVSYEHGDRSYSASGAGERRHRGNARRDRTKEAELYGSLNHLSPPPDRVDQHRDGRLSRPSPRHDHPRAARAD